MKPDDKDRGTVLLTTLFVMTVMAVVAVEIIDDIRFAVKRTINVTDYAQADWYMKGAEDFAATYLGDNLSGLSGSAKNRLFAKPVDALFPFDGGTMQLEIRDGNHCFSLGSLITESGAADDVSVRQLTALLDVLGWPANEAQSLTNIMTDWVDSDSQLRPGGAEDGDYMFGNQPHRTSNAVFNSVMELRAIKGMTEEQYQSLVPYFCARKAGAKTRFNINTATENDGFVLAALMGGRDSFAIANRLIAERPANGYEAADFKAAPALDGFEGKEVAYDQIIFEPANIWMEVRVDYKNASRLGAFEFELLDRQRVNLTYRGWGDENLRPKLTPPDVIDIKQ